MVSIYFTIWESGTKPRYVEPLVGRNLSWLWDFSEGKLMAAWRLIQQLQGNRNRLVFNWEEVNCIKLPIYRYFVNLAKVQEANGEYGYGFFIVDTTRPGVAFEMILQNLVYRVCL